MPQKLSQTIRNSFNKGLLTEFSELNFPNEASVDELNCTLFKAGNRTKRKGIKLEDNDTPQSGPFGAGKLYHTFTWKNVGKDANVEFVGIQAGNIIRFFEKGSVPLTDGAVPVSFADSSVYTLTLATYQIPGGLGAGQTKVDVASVNGDLIIVSSQIDAIRLTRDLTTGAFTDTLINFRVRDYEWAGDPQFEAAPYTVPSLSNPAGVERQYDTKNAGWSDGPNDIGDTALSTYTSANSAYPPLTHSWFSGKNSSGNFSVAEWEKIYSGTSLVGNGHYILNPFERDRSGVSGVVGLPTVSTDARFSCVASYAGRAWYSGFDDKVYYTQILESDVHLGDCFRVNDPTSEDFSDALATDGGYIVLPDTVGVKRLQVFGSSILVFADNGVWRISGVDGNLFDATSFSVFKITDSGLAFRTSLVSGQNAVPFWWSYVGIHTLQVTEEGGMVEVNLSRDTIQTFWEDIGSDERSFVTGTYDAFSNQVLWLYPELDETVEYKLNRILFLDIDIGAFFPWKVSDKDSATPFIVGTSFFSGKGSETVEFNVVDSNGDQVVDSLGNEVVVERSAGTVRSSNVYFLTRLDGNYLSFSLFDGADYLDWETEDYEAYAEAAYNFIGDLARRKNSPYITTFMRQTETGFVLNGATYDAVDESSLLVSAFWDFRKISSSTAQQAYRHKQPTVVDTLDLTNFATPTEVLSTRLKLRGRGRVVKLRFEGEAGKGFNLLGWETLDAGNPTY